MNQTLHRKLTELESLTDSIFESLARYENDFLQKKPSTESWSILQVLKHLQIAESGSLRYVKKKILGIDSVKDIGIQSQLGMFLLRTTINLKVKFKAPKAVSQPVASTSLTQAKEDWKTSRDELASFLNEYPDEYLNRALFKHPITGRISVPQMLDFFLLHVQHHQNQIDRIIKTLD